jgi:hypothetical protein
MQLQFRDPISYRGAPEQVDPTPLYSVGTIAKAFDIDPLSNYGEVELIYLKADSADLVGSVVTHGGGYKATFAVANAVGNIAASISVKEIGQYGWYVVKGNVPVLALTGFLADQKFYLTATAGSVDDAAVAGDDIFGAISVTAVGMPSAGLAVVNLNNSFVMDGLAA